MGKYGENASDIASQTGDSSSKVAEAQHTARDDATKDGLFERGNADLNSTPFSQLDGAKEATEAAQGFWGSIFGGKK